MTKSVALVGIDCAVSPKDVAIARGRSDGGQLTIDRVVACTNKCLPLQAIEEFLPSHRPLLFCFDAPLGWPGRLGEVLAKHRAGESVRSEAHSLFRRETDVIIKRITGQQPLDVGADRIARTAEAALTLLGALRQRMRAEIPLAWTSQDLPEISAIEVYPAATLRQLGINPRGYKKVEAVNERGLILNGIAADVRLTDRNAIATGHLLDAVLCVIAGSDSVNGRSFSPQNSRRAKQEGWIWVRRERRESSR